MVLLTPAAAVHGHHPHPEGHDFMGPDHPQAALLGDAGDGRVEVTYETVGEGPMRKVETIGGMEEEEIPGWKFNEPTLNLVSGLVVLLNAILMGVELDFKCSLFSYIEQASLVVFILDPCIRIYWHGMSFFAQFVNWLDIIIVVSGVFEMWVVPLLREEFAGEGHMLLVRMSMGLRLFRLVRVIRLLKLVTVAKPLYQLLVSLMQALIRVMWVMLLAAIFLYGFAIVFTELIGHNILNIESDEFEAYSHKFHTLPQTYFELFRVMNGDVTDFGPIMSGNNNVVFALVYMIFQVTASWLLLSIFTATVVDSTISNSQMDQEEEQQRHNETMREQQKIELTAVMEDVSPDNNMTYDQLLTFLQIPRNLKRVDDLLPGKQAFLALLHMWEAMETDGKVSKEDFVDGLVTTSNLSQGDIIMKTEVSVRHISKSISRIMEHMSIDLKRQPKMTFEGGGEREQKASHPRSLEEVWKEVDRTRGELVEVKSELAAMRLELSALVKASVPQQSVEVKAIAPIDPVAPSRSSPSPHQDRRSMYSRLSLPTAGNRSSGR